MVEYDPELIQKFANRLYTQSHTIILTYMILGAVAGSAAGYCVGNYLQNESPIPTVSGAVLVAALNHSSRFSNISLRA